MTNVAVSDSGTRERRDFKIIDETDDYIVVDKPPLLLIHPTKPNGATTLWAELRQLLAFEIASGGQVSIVNRLDRETSGIVPDLRDPNNPNFSAFHGRITGSAAPLRVRRADRSRDRTALTGRDSL